MIKLRLLLVIGGVASTSLFWPLFGQQVTDQLATEAKAIEGMLIAPCCWRQPVSAHYSPAADQVRSEIREMLASGATRKDVLARFVEEHGDQILAKPPASGFNLLAYFLPVGFLALGALVAFAVLKKLRPRRTASEDSKARPRKIDKRYAEKIDKELWG